MPRPRKIKDPARITIYVSQDTLDEIDRISKFMGGAKQDLVRRALDEFVERNMGCESYECECGFVMKVSEMTPAIEAAIKEHEKTCKVLNNGKNRKNGKGR